MRRAIAELTEVLVIALVSKTVMPIRVTPRQVFQRQGRRVCERVLRDQAVLSSGLHQAWAIKYGTTMRTDSTIRALRCIRDIPSPEPTERLDTIGRIMEVGGAK